MNTAARWRATSGVLVRTSVAVSGRDSIKLQTPVINEFKFCQFRDFPKFI